MDAHSISIEAGTRIVLNTAGKYCDKDIIVTAEGGGDYNMGYEEGYKNGSEDVLANMPIYNGETGFRFTIDGDEYEAEEGMTWYEWVQSFYNTGYGAYEIACGDDGLVVIDGITPIYTDDSCTEEVRGEMLITDGHAYLT